MADIEFKQRIYPIIKDMIFFSRISAQRDEEIRKAVAELSNIKR